MANKLKINSEKKVGGKFKSFGLHVFKINLKIEKKNHKKTLRDQFFLSSVKKVDKRCLLIFVITCLTWFFIQSSFSSSG